MNCLPWMLLWFSGLPSQKWVWPSTTKISLPCGVLNMVSSSCFEAMRPAGRSGGGSRRPADLRRRRLDVFEDVLHVAEQNHGVVVDANHAAVVGRGIHFEDRGRHLAAEVFGNLVDLENELAFAVDADQRRLIGDADVVFLAHELGDRSRLD